MKRLLAILVVMLVAVTGCSSGGTTAAAPETPVRMQLLIRQVVPPLEESFAVGQTVRVFDTKALLGTITDVAVDPARMAVPDSTGALQDARSPVQNDIVLTIEGSAVVAEGSYSFQGTTVWLNNDIDYLTPVTRFKGIIISMEEMDAE